MRAIWPARGPGAAASGPGGRPTQRHEVGWSPRWRGGRGAGRNGGGGGDRGAGDAPGAKARTGLAAWVCPHWRALCEPGLWVWLG